MMRTQQPVFKESTPLNTPPTVSLAQLATGVPTLPPFHAYANLGTIQMLVTQIASCALLALAALLLPLPLKSAKTGPTPWQGPPSAHFAQGDLIVIQKIKSPLTAQWGPIRA